LLPLLFGENGRVLARSIKMLKEIGSPDKRDPLLIVKFTPKYITVRNWRIL